MSSNFSGINCYNWLEYDNNPFFVFSKQGELLNLNSKAQFLLGRVDTRELYELALNYASMDFGYKTTHLELKFDIFSFFAVTVGYENEENIGIKLYQVPYASEVKPILLKQAELTNIYHMIDLCMVSALSKITAKFVLNVDPTLPEFRLPQNEFAKLLVRSFESFDGCEKVDVELKLKTGEFLLLSNSKFKMLKLKISSNVRSTTKDTFIDETALSINLTTNLNDKEAVFNIPLIL